MLWGDLVRETGRSIGQRLGRSLLATLASMLGVAAVIALVGLSQTASHQISLRFDERRSTVVYVEPASPVESEALRDAELVRVDAMSGVTSLARITVLGERTASVRASGGRQISITPVAASREYVAALDVELVAGTVWDQGVQDQVGAPVALLGETVVLELSLPEFDGPFTLWVAGRAVTVVGYVRAGGAEPRIGGWVLIPEGSADSDIWGEGGDTSIVVRVLPGAGAGVAALVPYALDPERPDRFVALAPPEPEVLRASIESDTRVAFLIAAAVALMVGALAIASATMTSVVERTVHYGIRRALGATKFDVARLVFLETLTLGILGGIAGCILGVMALLGVSIRLDWTPVFDPILIPIAIGVGAVVGAVAGLIPALKAANLDPIRAMRRA